MSSVPVSKDVVGNFLATFSTGDVDAILACMTDDATWWVSGQVPGMSGTNTKQALGELLREVKPLYVGGALRIEPFSMVAEGDKVAVEAVSRADLVGGRRYRNEYHFLFTVADGRIAAVKEYSDTQHMLEIFGP